MAERHRLSGLQVGETGHQGVSVSVRLGHQSGLQCLQLTQGAIAGLPHPKAEIQRHLVVARASGVKAAGDRADQIPQPGLHIHVDIFELVAKREGPRRHLGFDSG